MDRTRGLTAAAAADCRHPVLTGVNMYIPTLWFTTSVPCGLLSSSRETSTSGTVPCWSYGYADLIGLISSG